MDMMITSPVATDPCVWCRKELSSLARIPLFVATRSVALGRSQLLPPARPRVCFAWAGTASGWVSEHVAKPEGVGRLHTRAKLIYLLRLFPSPSLFSLFSQMMMTMASWDKRPETKATPDLLSSIFKNSKREKSSIFITEVWAFNRLHLLLKLHCFFSREFKDQNPEYLLAILFCP